MKIVFKSQTSIDLTTSQDVRDSADFVSLNPVDNCYIIEGGYSTLGNYTLYGICIEGSFTNVDKLAIIAAVEAGYALKTINI